MCAFTTSGVQLQLEPGDPVHRAAGASPMAFGTPADKEPPQILDCGVTPGLCRALEAAGPRMTLRLIGFGTVCQTWGGLLTGLPIDPVRASDDYPCADQGAMVFVFDPRLFTDLGRLKREMDEYAQRVRELAPVEGAEGAFLPGGVEVEREKQYRNEGIPLGERHQEDLEEVAELLGLEVPWR